MEQTFMLKEYGKLNLFEQNNMTSEDRRWWLKRLEREINERNKKERDSIPSIPSMPNMPSIPRR